MARPEKNTVDYFPFICAEGKKMFYLEETYGNDGFATFVKLLRELANTEYHYLDLSKKTTLMFLSAKCKVSSEILLNIIDDLSELGKFDSFLWNENKIVWCQDFIDGIQDAYKKRNNECITYNGLLHLLTCLGILKPSKSKSEVVEKPQTKVKEIKEEESKENKTKLNNSFLSEIKDSDVDESEFEYFEIAKAFQQLFIKNLKANQAPAVHQEKAKYKAYVDPIRLMMTTDGVSKEHLIKVFKFLDSPGGSFWKPNILSTTKLREKFNQLLLQSDNGNRNNNNTRSDADLKKAASMAVDKMFGRQ